jgi:pyruvate formate lyase activating enzyme
MATLGEVLQQYTVPGDLFETLDGGRVRCFACAHRCTIADGEAGFCRLRVNRAGKLYVPFGYVSGAQCDPVEKKPFFHVRPGASAYSFGMLGCNFHCSFCQNWVTSQALRESIAVSPPFRTTPDELVRSALDHGAEIVVSTYNEPLITGEWAVAVFRKARAAGLLTAYVSNGYATRESLEYLSPWLDLYKVDLKSFDEGRYRRLGGQLQPILETIRSLHEMGLWVEIVTLLIPGFNDSEEELTRLTEFIGGVSPDIPWHVTAFHKDYKMTGPENTAPGDLARAAAIGRKSGLRYIYAGNLPGKSGTSENTYCPGCSQLLVERYGYRILRNQLTPEGVCPSCRLAIPGRWADRSATR